MNSEDFNRGMVRNMEWEAKKAAQLDALYESERRKYDNVYGNNNSSYQQPSNNYPSDIESRLKRIENRIDKLYELIGQKNDNPLTNVSDKLFVFAPEANVTANQSISLTDAQFQYMMSMIMR
jgi:hypothetical protein